MRALHRRARRVKRGQLRAGSQWPDFRRRILLHEFIRDFVPTYGSFMFDLVHLTDPVETPLKDTLDGYK